MKRAFSISAVSVTTLVLLVSGLMAPMTASAADRQIKVLPKVKTFRVDDAAAQPSTEANNGPKIQEFRVNDDDTQQADATPAPRPDRPKVKRFRVEDETSTPDQSDQAEATPQQTPRPPKIQEFRVDDESDQAAGAVDAEPEVDLALKPEVKPKAPKPQIEQPEFADDEEETSPSTFDSAEDATDMEDEPRVYVKKKVYQVRYPRRYVSYNNYRHVKRHTYGHSSNYSGSNCNNNVGY